MFVFYRVLSLFIIVLCAGCNNSGTDARLIAKQRQNSKALLSSSSQKMINDGHDAIRFLSFSPDSQYVMVSYFDNGAHLYPMTKDKSPLIFSSKQYLELTNTIIENAGFIDNNNIYIAARVILEKRPSKFMVLIFQLSPEKLIYRHDDVQKGSLVKVNKNFIAIDRNLTHWHSKKKWEAQLAHPSILDYLLTNSGQVITYNWQNNWALVSDPMNDKHDAWPSDINIAQLVLSYNDNYLIALSHKGDCVVWRLADRSKVGNCGGGNWFSELKKGEIVANSFNDQFAVIRDNRITIYSLPLMNNVFDLTFNHVVGSAKFNGDLLVVTDEFGRAELWQVSNKKLLGTVPKAYLPTIQPNSKHLALIADHQLKLFKIPK